MTTRKEILNGWLNDFDRFSSSKSLTILEKLEDKDSPQTTLDSSKMIGLAIQFTRMVKGDNLIGELDGEEVSHVDAAIEGLILLALRMQDTGKVLSVPETKTVVVD